MKNFLIVLVTVLVLCAATSVGAQTTGRMELQNSVSAETVSPTITTFFSGPVAGKVGWSMWTLTSEDWSEAYPSLVIKPTKWFEVSGGLGLETDADPLRVGGSVFMSHGRLSLLGLFENGGSGYWNRTIGKISLARGVKVGVFRQTGKGIGPYAEAEISRLTLWATYFVSQESGSDTKAIIGVRLAVK